MGSRYAVISDVHSNMEALEAVLRDIKRRGLDEVIFLGDAVGYGPDPNECMGLLKEKCRILLGGNHDAAASGLIGLDFFNEYAKAAIVWTREVLTDEGIGFLKALPAVKGIKKHNMLLAHSTPKEPEAWHYLHTLWDAEINFHYFEQRICFIGHSHVPFIIERLPSGEMVTYRDRAELGESERYIINAGSVGQPRDRDPRACYALISGKAVDIVRVEYNIEKTQRKMRENGLPLPLIDRLSSGT